MNLKKIALTVLALGTTAYMVKHNKKNIKYKPVQNFNINNFLGRWYEIARLENKTQKNQTNVTHRFNINEGKDSLDIIIRGYNPKRKKWIKTEGLAKQDINNVGIFSAIFFPKIWRKLYIIDFDKEFNNLLVASENYQNLWILSRKKEISETVKTRFFESSKKVGFNPNNLIWPSHEPK